MALILISPGLKPVSYDALDSVLSSIKGGDVVALTTVVKGTSDLSSHADGYVNVSGVARRAVVTNVLASGARPLMLTDDGITGYGMGVSVVGGSVGQQVSGGAQLGMHTALGSGMVSCYWSPGVYGVSLDAVDTNATTGLQPTNQTLTSGAPLYVTAAGKLTPNASASFETDLIVGRFHEFVTNGSLVTTSLASKYTYAVFNFNPPV